MDRESILKKLIEIFRDNGIILLEDELEQPLDIDSLRFISITVQIEEEFSVMVPDEFLVLQEYKNISDFVHLIEQII